MNKDDRDRGHIEKNYDKNKKIITTNSDKQTLKGLYNWLGKHVNTSYGTYIFSLLVFIEGFFIVPVSTMLAFYCLENRQKSFLYAFLASLISIFSALAGYGIGLLLWNAGGQKIIHFLIAPEKFNYITDQYKLYQAWTIFIGALAPAPFKLITLTAGFCRLPLVPFLIFALIARSLRFYFIAISIYFWGEKFNYYLNKYFYYILVLGIAFIILLIWFIH